MPTYEFRCESGHTTDRFFRSINSAPAVIECPECGTSAVRQVSGGIGLVFKGSGFYITDYGKDGKKPRDTAKAERGGAEGGGEAKSEKGGGNAGDAGSSGTAAKDRPASGSTGSSGTDK